MKHVSKTACCLVQTQCIASLSCLLAQTRLIASLSCLLLFTANCCSQTDNGTQIIESDHRNFYGIAWVGNNDDNLAYAKQMGYDYVLYHTGMEDHALRTA